MRRTDCAQCQAGIGEAEQGHDKIGNPRLERMFEAVEIIRKLFDA